MTKSGLLSSVLLSLVACHASPSLTRRAHRFDGSSPSIELDAGNLGTSSMGTSADPDADAEERALDSTTSDGAGDAVDAGTAAQDADIPSESGEVIISELQVAPRRGESEWLELTNNSNRDLDLSTYTLRVASHVALGTLAIGRTDDPTGARREPLILAPGQRAFGVPNPSNARTIPNDATFVVGPPGTASRSLFDDAGDALSLLGPSELSDEVDFRMNGRGNSTTFEENEFPLIPGAPLSLDRASHDAARNNRGSAWCSPIFTRATRGLPNPSCAALLVSELLYDYASPTTGDDGGQEMIEIAGPAGASLTGVTVVVLDRDGAAVATIALGNGRVPRSGLFVIGRDAGDGTTKIDGAQLVAPFTLPDRAGAVQLMGSTGLLDAVAWGMIAAGAKDGARGLPMVEGAAARSLEVTAYPSVIARGLDELDTGDNARDFHSDPSPSPGQANAPPQLSVLEIAPDDALSSEAATIVVRGVDFTDDMTVRFGNILAPCTPRTANVLVCVLGPSAAQSAAHVAVEVATRPELGQREQLEGAFTFTRSASDTGADAECDYCVLQYPETLSASAGAPSDPIYGRIFERGRTDTAQRGPAPGLIAELGYGPVGTNPAASNAWSWSLATFNVEVGRNGNDDEYVGRLTVSTPGTYLYTMRFSLDGGLTFSYADRNGSGANSGLGFNPLSLGILTVR